MNRKRADSEPGTTSPGQPMPSFLNTPPLKVRRRIRRTAQGLLLLFLGSTWFWSAFVWKIVLFIASAVCLHITYWWWSVENQVKVSHDQSLYEGAAEPGVTPTRKNMQQLMASLVRRVSEAGPPSGKDRLKVCLLRGNAGGGHLAALNALKEVLNACNFDWELSEVDLPSALEKHENNTLHNIFNVTGEELYNWCLAEGTFLSSIFARMLSTASRVALFFCHNFPAGKFVGVQIAADIWETEKPDLVVSVITMLNRVAQQGLVQAGRGHIPFVVIVTDMEESFVHPWLQCREHHIIAGTPAIHNQAVRKRYPPERIIDVSGMVMRPSFYTDHPVVDREKELREIGLDPSRRTILLFYGGYAPNKLPAIARAVLASGQKVNLIFICGKNEELLHHLAFQNFDCPVHLVGYTRNVPHYMCLSDLCICKPGPAVVTEAAWFGLPLLIEHNMSTLAQEACVLTWATQYRVAHLWRRHSQLSRLTNKVFEDMGPVPNSTFRRIGHDIPPNYAIFQIPDLLSEIVKKAYRKSR